MDYKTLYEQQLEENKKLKEANDTFTLGAKRTIESNCKLYQENKELQEENEQLKKKFKVLNSVQEEFRKQMRKEMDILCKAKEGDGE
jgi:hypothetical protein